MILYDAENVVQSKCTFYQLELSLLRQVVPMGKDHFTAGLHFDWLGFNQMC